MRLITPVERLEELSPTPEQDEALVKVYEIHVLDSQHPDLSLIHI